MNLPNFINFKEFNQLRLAMRTNKLGRFGPGTAVRADASPAPPADAASGPASAPPAALTQAGLRSSAAHRDVVAALLAKAGIDPADKNSAIGRIQSLLDDAGLDLGDQAIARILRRCVKPDLVDRELGEKALRSFRCVIAALLQARTLKPDQDRTVKAVRKDLAGVGIASPGSDLADLLAACDVRTLAGR